jgi:hypothetical protein
METFTLLYEDLHNCYSQKARYSEDYLKLSNFQRSALCQKERDNLIFHLNSDQMIFENILKERLRWMKSKSILI